MGNLFQLLFGMKLCLNIGFLHTTGLLRHNKFQKNWKRQKKFIGTRLVIVGLQVCKYFLGIHFFSWNHLVNSSWITTCMYFQAEITKLELPWGNQMDQLHCPTNGRLVQSPLHGRVTKKYDIYRNNNKKTLVTLANLRLLVQFFLWSKYFSFLD